MILTDSNIMIDYFRSRNSELAQKIDRLPIAVCGVVKTEVLHGAKTDDETDDMLKAFQTFESLFIEEYDWEFIGIILQMLRKNGITVPMADAIIAYTAMKYDVPLWTRDEHFKFIKAVYPELELYQE